MKKLTPKRRRYQLLVAAKRDFHRLSRLPRKKVRATKTAFSGSPQKIKKFSAPEIFSLATTENRDLLMPFLRRLQDHVRSGGRANIIFDKTKTLLPCGTLLFVAVLNCLLKRFPNKITSNYPCDPVVEQLFQHIGIMGLLGNSSRATITADSVRYWHYLHGTTADTSPLKNLFNTYSSELKEGIREGLYDSLSEAITNTVQHAYEGGDTNPDGEHGKRWWMFSQHKDGKLTVVVCDLGIGIPSSLRQKIGDHVRYAIGKKRRETQFIEIAVQSKRSRTKLDHRGKGLPDMLEFVKGSGIGGFLIYSLHGSLSYSAERANETGRDFPTGIPGTLIQWTVPFN